MLMPTMQIQQLRIQNYRVFRDVVISDIPTVCVFIGANGSGKSTLFDVFAFLKDSLVTTVHESVDRRGGWRELHSRGEEGPISIDLQLRDAKGAFITYELAITEHHGRVVVSRERIKYQRGLHGAFWTLLDARMGVGSITTNEDQYGNPDAAMALQDFSLESPETLAIKAFGQLSNLKVVSGFRRLVEGWHLSDFHVRDARLSQETGHAEHLSPQGDNLPLVTHYIYAHHRPILDRILERMKQRVPGVSNVEAEETVDGRLVLRFQDGAFKDPFLARYVSDGTIKMFAYLVLLHDPSPHPLLCIEEPENQLYPTLLAELVEEFVGYARRGGQVMVSTHSPDLLDAVSLEDVFWLEKHDGFSIVKRASDDLQIKALMDEGDSLGALWKQGLFGAANP
jgi:predicted ATPase